MVLFLWGIFRDIAQVLSKYLDLIVPVFIAVRTAVLKCLDMEVQNLLDSLDLGPSIHEHGKPQTAQLIERRDDLRQFWSSKANTSSHVMR